MSRGQVTNWSCNTHFQKAPRNPMDDYRGGKLNRAQRRALKRKKKAVKR